jgi:hypothetical protein
LFVTLAALLALQISGCLITITSAYTEIIFEVSPIVSHFDMLDVCPSETLITLHHSLYMADSKESLVLVDGSKKSEAIIFHNNCHLPFSHDNTFSIS